MNIRKKQVSILFISLYLVGMIISAFTLLDFRNELIYDFNVLSISDAETIDPAFTKLYVIIGLSLILGLLATYFSFKADESDIIYVEKKAEDERQKMPVTDAGKTDAGKINKEKLDHLILNKKPLKPAILEKVLSAICKQLEASQGAIYIAEPKGRKNIVRLKSSYAMSIAESHSITFEFGEGLIGQVAKEQKTLYINDIPEGFVKIVSGLGQASPKYLLILPVMADGHLSGVVEIAGFLPVISKDISTLEEFLATLGEFLKDQASPKVNEQETVLKSEAVIAGANKKIKKKKAEGK